MSAASRPRLAKTPVVNVDDPPEWAFASLDHVKTEKVQWLMRDRLALGFISILDGEKGCGKSTFAAAIAAAVTAGKKLPGGKKIPPAGVLWLTSEESYAVSVKPRLVAAGCDMSRVHIPDLDEHGQRKQITFPSRQKTVSDAIVALGIRLIVLDPLVSHIDAGTNENQQQEMRPVLEGIARIADAHSVLVLAIRQYGKDRSKSRADQGLGSASIGAVARTMLSLDHPDPRSARHVLRVQRNNLGVVPPALSYDHVIANGQVTCGHWSEIAVADDDADSDQCDIGERSTREEARQLLRLLCATEYIPSQSAIKEAEACGIKPHCLRRAKAELRLHHRRVGTASPPYWEWGPPKGGW